MSKYTGSWVVVIADDRSGQPLQAVDVVDCLAEANVLAGRLETPEKHTYARVITQEEALRAGLLPGLETPEKPALPAPNVARKVS